MCPQTINFSWTENVVSGQDTIRITTTDTKLFSVTGVPEFIIDQTQVVVKECNDNV